MNVEVIELRKVFGHTIALDSISFSLTGGQIVAFVGSNGAGKTTTLKILATLLQPTSGDVLFDGISIIEHPEKVRPFVGYMPDSLPTHRDMTVHEYLDFFARAYGLKGRERRARVEEIEEFTNLGDLKNKFLNALSKGMKQRVSLARALVHDPQLLLMDEPAAGLDPRARMELRVLITLLAEQGKAILISSHILSELDEICTDALIIEKGQLVKSASLDETEFKMEKQFFVIKALMEPRELYKKLLLSPIPHQVELVEPYVEVELDAGEEAAAHFLRSLVEEGILVSEFKRANRKLEELFMNVTEGDVQ